MAAWLFLLTTPFTLAAAAADQPQITLSADKNKVGMDDTFELQLTVSGAGGASMGDPVIEGVEHFDQLGTSRGEQLSIVNMNITRATTWRYTLRPKKAGESVTLRAKVPVGGTNYLSGTVAIETTKGGGGQAPPPPGMFNFPAPSPFGAQSARKDDFILQARVAPTAVYVGEEAVYTLAFYQGADVFSNINFAPPTLKNTWTEQPDDGERHETKSTRAGGRGYRLTEVRTLLYPMSAGDMTIPAAAVSFQPTPFSAPAGIKSNELTLKVKPLPEKGKPAGFSGLVGSFSIASSLSQKSGAVGRPLTFTVTVSGRGALHAIPRPAEPAIDAERYDPEIKDAFHRGARGSDGSRTFSYIIVPKKEGTLTIPPFSLTFFNPASAIYETVRSAPLTVPVTAAPAVNATPTAPPPAPEAGSAAPANSAPFYRRQLFYAVLATLTVAAIGMILYRRRREAVRNDRGAAHALRAEPVARERLARAEEYLRRNDTAAFLGAVEHAVRGYLSDRLNIPPSAVTPDDIARRLPAETREDYRECLSVLQACFAARYSPGVFEESAALLEQAKKAVAMKIQVKPGAFDAS